jgi:hypothetical protein
MVPARAETVGGQGQLPCPRGLLGRGAYASALEPVHRRTEQRACTEGRVVRGLR